MKEREIENWMDGGARAHLVTHENVTYVASKSYACEHVEKNTSNHPVHCYSIVRYSMSQ